MYGAEVGKEEEEAAEGTILLILLAFNWSKLNRIIYIRFTPPSSFCRMFYYAFHELEFFSLVKSSRQSNSQIIG